MLVKLPFELAKLAFLWLKEQAMISGNTVETGIFMKEVMKRNMKAVMDPFQL